MAEEINQPLSNTYSPLEFAIECGMEARVVKAFVAAGANIRHTITSGYGSPIDNALTLAIKRGDLDLVTFLVETDQKKKNEEELALDKRQNLSPVLAAGALDFQDRLGRTPLILALTLGLTDIAKFLIGIDLENRTKSRMFYRDNLEKYKEHLIQSALDNNRIDSKRSRSPELFLILQNAGIVFSQDLLEQALKYRCSAESIREIIRIVGTPSNIHNCLEIALSSYRGCKDADMEAIIAVFIEAGLDINQQDEKGDTILSRYISEFSNSRIVKTLLRCGADPNIANNYGEIPLNKATMGANFNQEICQTLLAKTSIDSLNKVDSHGCTIFHHLANFLDDSSALFMTACQARKDSKHIKFNQAGANKETPLFQAALRGNCAIYDILMRTDEDAVNKVTKNGRTILHAAALGGNIKIIESALKYSKGATPLDINARDSEGKTALSLAIKAGNIIAINALLEAGADYDLLEIKRVLSEASKFRNKEAEKLLEIFETQSKSERRIRDMVINLAQKLATEKDRGEIDKESTALSLEALDSLRERIFCGIELCPFNEHPIAFVTNSGTYSYNNNTAGTRSLMHNPSTREPILARVKDLNVGDATKHIKTSAAKLYATLIYGCVKSRDVKTAEKYLADSLNEYDIKLFDILEYLEVLIKETHEEKVARLLLEIKELGTPPPSLSHDGVLMEDPVMTILTGSGVSVERKYVESNTQYFPPKCNPNPNPGAKFPTNFTLKNITEAYGKYQSAALRFFDRELQKIEKPSATTMTRSDGAAAMDEKTLLR